MSEIFQHCERAKAVVMLRRLEADKEEVKE
jgi:hypothetical protein